MTKQAIEKLTDNQRHWLEVVSDVINDYRKKGNAQLVTEYSKKMRGFLEALEVSGIISTVEMRGLYNYFITKGNA